MTDKLHVLRTVPEIESLRAYLKDKEFVSYDTETTGLDKESNVIGFSVCADVDEAYYIILAYWEVSSKKLIFLPNREAAIALLNDLKDKKGIGHNVLFDVWMIQNNFNINLLPSVFHDTMISGHLLNENESQALKERGIRLYGDDAGKEQREMKESVTRNGGVLTKTLYELYKADPDLIGKYGAQDALLTFKLFLEDVPALYEQGLDKFFYEEESMPLLRSATYELNYTGMKIDQDALRKLKAELEAEIAEAGAYIRAETAPHVKEEYPGTSKVKTFNINACQQLSWLLFIKLNNMFGSLTKGGRELCKELDMKVPYSNAAKREWLKAITELKGRVYVESKYNPKTKKMTAPKKVGDPWKYMAAGKESLTLLAKKYRWVAKLLEYKKNEKLLGTYVEGIQDRLKYGIIYPSFLQHGTTSGRYSSRYPNFQNLPRTDKRIKSCVVARPGKVFVGADQSQLEPRCFASTSQDPTLMACFAKGEDFYSVVGVPIFEKFECTMFKDDENGFAKKHPDLRDISKQFALASPYGTTGFQQSLKLGLPADECDQIIRKYFDAYPKVELMMLESHEQVMTNGVVYNLFGRPRRMPEGKSIRKIYGNTPHHELPYKARNILNLACNHRIQSTAASIMNRIAISLCSKIKDMALIDTGWSSVHLVIQVHDSLVLEGPERLKQEMSNLLKGCMEHTIELTGVGLEAEPKIGYTLAEV